MQLFEYEFINFLIPPTGNKMNILETFKKKVQYTIKGFYIHFKNKQLQKYILDYYKKNPIQDKEIKEGLAYITNTKKIDVFPYPFRDKYNAKDILIYTDPSNGLYYVIRNEKRLYLRRDITYKTARNVYNRLLIEQDPESPHLYQTEYFNINENDILVDIGSAEGFLTLDVIEKVKKVYLFEYEEDWIEALNYTFAPWKEKVEIIKRYVSDISDGNNIALDDFFKSKEELPTFVKIDVEGAEMQVLHGMEQIIKSASQIKLAICTYHKADDYKNITQYVSELGLKYTTSRNYMLSDIPPYFRRGLIRVEKK